MREQHEGVSNTGRHHHLCEKSFEIWIMSQNTDDNLSLKVLPKKRHIRPKVGRVYKTLRNAE